MHWIVYNPVKLILSMRFGPDRAVLCQLPKTEYCSGVATVCEPTLANTALPFPSVGPVRFSQAFFARF